MGKILIVYASMTGNTETIANLIESGMKEQEVEVEKKEVIEIEAHEINNYKGIVLGTYTWGDGELPDDFLDFYDDMENMDLSGKMFAVFGSGDPSYEQFCGAVDLLENRITENGGKILLDSLKVELVPVGEEEELCKQFGQKFASMVKESVINS